MLDIEAMAHAPYGLSVAVAHVRWVFLMIGSIRRLLLLLLLWRTISRD